METEFLSFLSSKLPANVVEVLIENGVDESIFNSLTEGDLYQMFPGKVGYARKVLLIANSFVNVPNIIADFEILDESDVDETVQEEVQQEVHVNQKLLYKSAKEQQATTDGEVHHGLFTVPEKWPNYSDRVLGALKSGNILPDWDVFISETAYFILRYHNIKKPGDYNEVGRLICERWPCIGFIEHGKHPWNHFVKRLSQKIRNIRWKRKKKSVKEPLCKRAAVARADYTIEEKDSNIERSVKELISESKKENPDNAKIAYLQKETFSLRKTEKPSFEKYPFLLEAKFMKKEFFLKQTEVTESYVKQNWLNLIDRLTVCAKEDKLERTDEIDLIDYLEDQISVTKRVEKIKPVISVADNTYIPESVACEAPRLVVVKHGEEPLSNGFILHNGHTVETPATNLFELVLSLMQAYYVWDLRYPIQYQILGFFQIYLLGDKKSQFKKSSNSSNSRKSLTL